MLLSDKLKEVAFIEIDDPIKYFDKLVIEAKKMEAIVSVHSILIEELGNGTIENALKNYFEKNKD